MSSRALLNCAFLALFFHTGCDVNSGLNKLNDDVVPPKDDTEHTGVFDTSDVDEEICDGKDNDGDGDIDEGFRDIDGDGIADCVDTDCEITLASAKDVDLIEECIGYDPDEVTDPWNLSVEWSNTSIGASVVTPVVGNLTDDNGDGTVDELDNPDIVVSIYGQHKVVALHGDGSGIIWTAIGMRHDGGIAIGDVDNDGEPEVVGVTSSNQVRSLDGATGATEWTSASTFTMVWPVTTIADVDADGKPEVIADAGLVNGADGSTIASLTPSNPSCWRAPVVGDLDLDGDMEIILGNTVFDHTGTSLWSATGTGTSCFSALANLDTDPQAEIIWTFGSEILMYEHDGTLIRTASGSARNPGPPCVGDLDGDGDPEIAAPAGNVLRAYEADGTIMWSQTIRDSSGAAGCSVFDMNGDLTYEVLQADETAMRIFDGATGTILYENSTHGSVTYFEYPVVADIDLDGSAEIITSSSSGYTGVTVFGHNGDGWPASGPNWQVHDFGITNVTPNSSVPIDPDPSWLVYNVFRGRPATDFAGQPDLVVDFVDMCVASCELDGRLMISYQVSNQGEGDVDAGTPLTLYKVDGTTRTVISTITLDAIPSGKALAGGFFDLLLGDIGTDGWVLAIDDDGTGDGTVTECDETNNEYKYLDSPC